MTKVCQLYGSKQVRVCQFKNNNKSHTITDNLIIKLRLEKETREILFK